MKKTLLFSTLATGLILAGCNKSTNEPTTATDSTYPPSTDTTASDTYTSAEAATRDASNDIVRTKDTAGAPTGNMDESTLQNSVEGRIKADPQLSSLELDVNAKSAGEIELEGEAQSAEQIGRAIALALDTDGVTKVSSDIKVTAQKQ